MNKSLNLRKKDNLIYERVLLGEKTFNHAEINKSVLRELSNNTYLDKLVGIPLSSLDEEGLIELTILKRNEIKDLYPEVFANPKIMVRLLIQDGEMALLADKSILENIEVFKEVLKYNELIIYEENFFPLINKENAFDLVKTNFIAFSTVKQMLSKSEIEQSIDFLIEKNPTNLFYSDFRTCDATIKQARKLSKYNIAYWNTMNNEQKKDLKILCSIIKLNQESLGYQNKEILEIMADCFSHLSNGFIQDKYLVDDFIKFFKGNITKEVWSAMICSKSFFDKLIENNIDPFQNPIDDNYSIYIRKINLNKILAETKSDVVNKVKRKV